MTWNPVNLAAVEQRPPIMPTLGALGLVYPGRRHVFSGPPESGKTIVAYIETLSVIRAGGRVVLIDLEMGPWDARDRLRDLGATDDELAAIHYIEPETPATTEIIAGLVALAPDLVVIDAAAGAYELQNLDDNKRQDVETFARLYVRAFWSVGIATIVLDHVTKNTDGRGRFAIGSERKIGGADVHLGFEAVKAISRGHNGVLKVTTHKDRFGHLPRPVAATLRLASDPDTHAISWTLEASADDTEDDGWKPTQLMEKVSRHLEQTPDPQSRSEITRSVRGKKAYVLSAIDHLVTDGYATATAGARGASLITSTHPFRVPDPFPPVPGTAADITRSPFLPPTGGNGSGNGSDDSEAERLIAKYGNGS